MKRFTTDGPNSCVEWMLNFSFVKDKEVYLRGMDDGDEMSLVEYCKRECKAKCDIDHSNVPVDEFADNMVCDCPVSVLYSAAVGAAELRERLSKYEDTGLEPEEIQTAIAVEELLKMDVLPLLKQTVEDDRVETWSHLELIRKIENILRGKNAQPNSKTA